jgi:hypothetical protein
MMCGRVCVPWRDCRLMARALAPVVRRMCLTQIERQASGFSPRFERSGRDGLLLLNVLPQYFNRGTAA